MLFDLFTNDNTNITAYSTLIVGKWQLTEIGKKPCSATCFMKETTWVKSTTSTLLDFKATGEFTKNGFCTSKFSITNEGHLATQSDCLVEKFITRLTHTELVLDAPDRTTCYKYARL